MSREAIQLRLDAIKAEAALLASRNGRWYADDLIAAMQKIKTCAEEVEREAWKLRGGDR